MPRAVKPSSAGDGRGRQASAVPSPLFSEEEKGGAG